MAPDEHCHRMRVVDLTRKYQLFHAARGLVQGQLSFPAEKALQQVAWRSRVVRPRSQLYTPQHVCTGASGTTLLTPTRGGRSWRPCLQRKCRLCKKNTRAVSRYF